MPQPLEMSDLFNINGTLADFVGQVFSEILCEAYIVDNEVVESANVTHFKIKDDWYRLYFDFNIIFCRVSKGFPVSYTMPELGDIKFDLENIGQDYNLKNQRIIYFKIIADNDKIEVIFYFENSMALIIEHVHFCMDGETNFIIKDLKS